MTWGLYGWAMLLLWHLAGGNSRAEAAVWWIALVAGLGLVLGTLEF